METEDHRRPKARRGFAAMSKKKQQAIASMGGKAVHALGLGFVFTTETARAAGRKGGRVSADRRRNRAEEGATR